MLDSVNMENKDTQKSGVTILSLKLPAIQREHFFAVCFHG